MSNLLIALGKKSIWIIPSALLSRIILVSWSFVSRKNVSVYKIPDRFGHQLVEPDIYFAKCLEGKLNYIHLAIHPQDIFSKTLLNMWKKKFKFFPQFLLRSLYVFEEYSGKFRFTQRVKTSPRHYLATLNYKPMQVAVSGELISNKQAQELLSKVRKPIIFLTIRDIRYDQKIRMHTKGMHARYRNSSIGNYEPAIRYLIESGYFVVRGGEAGENCGFTLATDFLDLTDAKFDLFRDEMQFVLASRSSFFIGSDTGAIHLATLFRKPFFRVNISSSLSMGRGSVYEKLSLFREFVDRESGKLLNFEQIAKRGLLTCSHDDDFEKVGVVSIENTAEHILDFTQECVQYFLGNWTPNANSVTLSRYYDEICFKYGFEKQGVKFSNNWSNQYASLINQSIVT